MTSKEICDAFESEKLKWKGLDWVTFQVAWTCCESICARAPVAQADAEGTAQYRLALRAIAEFFITDLENQDAANMKSMAVAALSSIAEKKGDGNER